MSIDASFSVAAYSCRQRRCSTFFQYALYTARVKSAALLLLRWHHMWLRIPLQKRIFSRSKTLPCAASNDHLVGSIDSYFLEWGDSKKKLIRVNTIRPGPIISYYYFTRSLQIWNKRVGSGLWQWTSNDLLIQWYKIIGVVLYEDAIVLFFESDTLKLRIL